MKILQLSGGKDSLACLLLYKDQLSEITVMWGDTGDSFPETIKQMEMIKEFCPNFITVKGNQPEIIEKYGFPVDVLPIRNNHIAQKLLCLDRPKLQGFWECCYNSFLKKMHDKCVELGATHIIRGQKICDKQKSPLRSGDVVDGITYIFPVENWSDEDVIEFVSKSGILPKHYKQARTGLDCLHCTAHLFENQWKMKYLEENHPVVAKEVTKRYKIIREEISRDLVFLDNIIGGNNGPNIYS